jgi:hypothetical protein
MTRYTSNVYRFGLVFHPVYRRNPLIQKGNSRFGTLVHKNQKYNPYKKDADMGTASHTHILCVTYVCVPVYHIYNIYKGNQWVRGGTQAGTQRYTWPVPGTHSAAVAA